MKFFNKIEDLNEKHLIYLYYSIPILFLIGRAQVDIVFSYLGLNLIFVKFIINRNFAIFKNKIFFYGFLFCLANIFISFFSSNIENSLFKSLTYLRFVFFLGASVYIIQSKNFILEIFFKILLFSLILINIDIFIQYIFKFNLLGYEPVKIAYNSYRYSGFFGDEFIAGSYIQKFLLIFVILTISNVKNFYKKFYSESFIFFSILIILITGDRMAFISVIYTIFFIYIFYKQLRKSLLILTLILATLLGSFLAFDKSVFDRLITIKTQLIAKKEGEFYNPHLNLIRQSIKIYKNNIIFGSGIKTFRTVCSLEKNKVIFNNTNLNQNFCSTHPHNYFFEVLSETGTVGFLVFNFFIGYLLFISGFSKKYNLNNRLGFVCLLVFLFPISTTGSFFTNLNASYFWFMISILNFKLTKEKSDN